jgi:hypothetical protein
MSRGAYDRPAIYPRNLDTPDSIQLEIHRQRRERRERTQIAGKKSVKAITERRLGRHVGTWKAGPHEKFAGGSLVEEEEVVEEEVERERERELERTSARVHGCT